MKKIILGILLLTIISINAQDNLREPTFVGEAFIIETDGSIVELDKERVQLRIRAGAGVYLAGIGKFKTKIDIPKCCSQATISSNGDIKLVVKADDNRTDPLTIIKVFKFKKKKKKRLAEIASFGTFSGGSTNNLDYL